MFLLECKYAIKGKMILKYIIDGIEISSDRKNSDEKNSIKENFDEKNYDEEIKKKNTNVTIKNFYNFFVYIYENGYKLQKEACERYQNLSEEEKEIM